MTLTLLLDLDDTLLDTRMAAFVPAYFQALSVHLGGLVPPEAMLRQLMLGTRAMMENRDPTRTLREVFDSHFFAPLGVERERLQPEIDRFYEEVFPTLRGVTGGPLPGAADFVGWAFAQGFRVAVATDPYFPRRAVEHRLDWAGLPVESTPFALVSSYETFHFTKAHPDYFAEFLARLGWPEGPTVMVGDDWERDVTPCLRAGLPVFWLAGPDQAPPEGSTLPAGRGSLADLRPWLLSAPAVWTEAPFRTPAGLLAVLRSTPAALASRLSGLTDADWQRRSAPGEWSVAEILCHLRDVDQEVNLPRVRAVLAQDNPFLAGQETDRWAGERNYGNQAGAEALTAFVAARVELLSLLDGLAPSDLDRPARHAYFGPTTLRELIAIMGDHDRLHIRQIWRALEN